MATEWHHVAQAQFDNFMEKLKARFSGQSVSVVESAGFIPDTGAFVEIKNQQDAEILFLCEIVVILCRNRQESYEEALKGGFTQACFVSAESKTADIEKKLISGVHGPKECIFVEIQ